MMDEDQPSSERSHGSEARPNTPLSDPFAGLDLLGDSTECTGTIKDAARETWIPEDNTRRNHADPQLSNKHTLTKRNTVPNLPSLTERAKILTERKNENIRNGSNERKMNGKYLGVRKLQNCNDSGQNSPTITDCSKCVVPLPKIDTYCISYVRPSTNHGFAYAVSSSDLLHAKMITPRKMKQQNGKSVSKDFANNNLQRQGSMYLLFRAPSRACGLNIPGLTIHARPKELHYLKGAKQAKKSNAAVKTSIVRLPDINEDMWK